MTVNSQFSTYINWKDFLISRVDSYAFSAITVFLLIFMAGCMTPPETIKKNYEQIGDVDLLRNDQTLDTFNRILLMEERKTETPEINTAVYVWYNGAVRAKFIEEYKSGAKNYKLVELEIREKGAIFQQSPLIFPGSIFGAHLTDPPDKIPEILSKHHCRQFNLRGSYGDAICGDWMVFWYSYEGKITDFRARSFGYTTIPVNR